MLNQEEQQQQQLADSKPRIMTGYIHYGESDDLIKLFDILNEFRKNNGLKYSHQSRVSMIFFNVSSEHLDAFSKVRPFKISRFQTKSEYKCDNETSLQLIAQKDSFLRILWDENTGILTFLSRTPSRVHGNLVRRIFKDSGIEFQKDNYNLLRNFSVGIKNNNDQNGDDNKQEINKVQQSNPEGFQRVDSKRTRKPREFTSFNQSREPRESRELREPRESREPRETTSSYQSRKTNFKVETETESKPKVRGIKPSRTLKSTI